MITIFTPTFNRAHTLITLYQSLTRQTNKNFVWLVVDDGSSDGTDGVVKHWQKENLIKIEYIYQENAGKMQAHNTGVLNTKTELFLCVDSDDFLSDNAVDEILKSYKDWGNNQEIAGIVAYKVNKEGAPLGTEFPDGIQVSSLNDLYRKGFKGDTTLVFRTSVIKEFLFPKIEGEKFLTEDYVYCQIDEKYKYVVLPLSLTICEYLQDGYTTNILKVKNKNPKGMALYYNLKTSYAKSFLEGVKYSAGYICYSKIAKEKKIFKQASSKFKFIIAYMLGVFLYYKRRNIK